MALPGPCLMLALILSYSIASATVFLDRDQDEPICASRKLTFKCTTVTVLGSLRWIVNGVTEYNINSLIAVNDNVTMDGSLFVFDSSSTIASANVYTSTATLNTSHVASSNSVATVRCSDGGSSETRTNLFRVEDRVNITGKINGTTVTVEWTGPAGDCCVQFLVMTSESSMPFVTMDTSCILPDLSTQERQEDAFVSVRCLDMIGTQGPEVVYKPVVGRPSVYVSPPLPYPALNGRYEISFENEISSSSEFFAEITGCNVTASAQYCVSCSCDHNRKKAYISRHGFDGFLVAINFAFQLNGLNDSIQEMTKFNSSQGVILQKAYMVTPLTGGCAGLAVLSLILILIVVILVIVVCAQYRKIKTLSKASEAVIPLKDKS